MPHSPQTPEAVAYALLHDIARAEKVALAAAAEPGAPTDRRWILETFAECLKCVRAEAPKTQPSHGRSSF